MDLYNRKVIGYAFGKSPTAMLVKEALDNAIFVERPQKGVILHSDQGTQYTSNLIENYCKEKNIRQSFSAKGCPFDNAPTVYVPLWDGVFLRYS